MDSPNSIAVTLAVRPALNVRLPALQRPNCTVEIEARAVTIERLFMISERERTFGETLEYSLDRLS